MSETFNVSGIKCDAAGCGWTDEHITRQDYPQWLGRPCPSCGANLLTEADLRAVKMLENVAKWHDRLAWLLQCFGVKLKRTYKIPVEMDGTGTVKLMPPERIS